MCKDIDERVNDFLDRPLTGEWPYLWLDATYLKVRQGGRIVSVAAILAVAVNTDGRREIIGMGLGPSEAETFWTEFLRGLKGRGLDGVKLVISDAHRRRAQPRNTQPWAFILQKPGSRGNSQYANCPAQGARSKLGVTFERRIAVLRCARTCLSQILTAVASRA